MAYFILGFVVGIGLGVWITQRWHQVRAQRLALADGARVTATLVPPAADPDELPPITRKAAKLGITPDDLRPSDDILVRMQRAWDLGISLEELDAREAADGGGATRPGPALPSTAASSSPPPPPGPEATGAAASPSTVTEAVERLSEEGYADDLRLHAGELGCSACGTEHPTDLVLVDRVFRFEGPSDPADEAIVLGLRCPACGARGSLVSAFGPDADPDLAQAFVYLASRAEHG
jgi:hypothetical protein